jgi:hypothetical protein
VFPIDREKGERLREFYENLPIEWKVFLVVLAGCWVAFLLLWIGMAIWIGLHFPGS